jgi:hypothetical protein
VIEPDRGQSGYLSLALAQRLLNEGEQPAAIVCMSPLMQIAKVPKINPCRPSGGGNEINPCRPSGGGNELR